MVALIIMKRLLDVVIRITLGIMEMIILYDDFSYDTDEAYDS